MILLVKIPTNHEINTYRILILKYVVDEKTAYKSKDFPELPHSLKSKDCASIFLHMKEKKNIINMFLYFEQQRHIVTQAVQAITVSNLKPNFSFLTYRVKIAIFDSCLSNVRHAEKHR